jgi:peptidylprolyl isomerase
MNTVEPGDSVRVHYEGRLESGEVFDSSKGRDPIRFEAGSSQIIPGFSNGVVGMAVGDKKTLTLPPSEAYGEHDPKMVQRADLDVLPEGVKVGDRLQAQSGEHVLQVLVTEMDESGATLDGNHPLAGETLVFDVELVGIEPTGT